MIQHPTSIPFNCRCGHGIDIPLSGLGAAVECDECGYVSDYVPASVAEYVGVCSRTLIWVLHDFGRLPRKIPRSKPSLNKDLLAACTIVVCSGTIAACSNVANKQYQPATARSEHLLDDIRELTVKAGVALHTLDLYLPLSRHSRQGEIRCGNYIAPSYVEIPPLIAHRLLEEFKLLAIELKKRPGDEDFSLVWPAIRREIVEIVDVPHAEIDHRIRKECFGVGSDTVPTCDTVQGDEQLTSRLLSVFTNGLADQRLSQATSVLKNDNLTAGDKLSKIDDLMRFPPTASAADLGKLVGVSRHAVMKTAWWSSNRKGRKEDEVGRRRDKHLERSKKYEPNRTNNEDD